MTGDTLRQERERQELTIQDVEKGTSIRAVYIEALEKGEYDKLPGEVYAKGFVKNYANFLNLNADELAKEFAAEITPPVVEVAEDVPVEEEKVVVEETPKPKQSKTKITELQEPDIKLKKSGESSSSSMIIAAVLLIAILAGGFWYYTKNSTGEVAKVDPPKQTEVTQTANNPVSAAVPQEGVNIQATFDGDCWTRVLVDGAFVYEGIPSAGQTFDWHGAEGVTIRVGNAGAVDIIMNGQNLGKLGAFGEVMERTFTKNLP